jgi:cobyrinic acid a,c-diamide synthase
MSVPRLVLCGLEPGPALALVAGALLARCEGERTARAVSVGVDLPLWRLLNASPGRAPRVLDPALHDDSMLELYDSWSSGCDLVLIVSVEPVLDRWQGVKGSRAVDVAAGLDAPLVLVLDARERGATVAAAAYGVRAMAGRVELAGVIVVGGDERGAGAELGHLLRTQVGVPILGWMPPQLSEQFARQYSSSAGGGVRQIGPRPVKGGEQRLCKEAATYLDDAELMGAATRRGFVPARARRLLTPVPAANGLTLAVAWGPPLEPFALENVDLLQAMGVTLAPFNVSRDRELPPETSGLLIAGGLDEEELPAFAANTPLKEALAQAIADGLPTLAMGGGALLLLGRLADSRGRSHELAGVLPAEAELLEWYERPRYVRAQATPLNPFDRGDNVLYELFDLEFLLLEQESFAYQVGAPGEEGQAEGFARGRCLATTLYASLPRCPAMAACLLEAMRLEGPRP